GSKRPPRIGLLTRGSSRPSHLPIRATRTVAPPSGTGRCSPLTVAGPCRHRPSLRPHPLPWIPGTLSPAPDPSPPPPPPPPPPRTARLHGSSRRGRPPAESSRAPNGPPNRADRATPSRRRAAAWWRLRQRPLLDRCVPSARG